MKRAATFLLAMLLSTAAHAAEYMEKTPFQLSRAFSPGVITSGGTIVWVAGQTATQDSQGNNIANNFEAQVKQVFAQVDGVLKRAGGSLDNVVTMTVFIKESRYGDKICRNAQGCLQGWKLSRKRIDHGHQLCAARDRDRNPGGRRDRGQLFKRQSLLG